jgi:hypothetical protein
MKSRTLVSILILVLIVCSTVLAGSGKKEEELYGTWVNSDYNKSAESAKVIVDPDPGIRDDANGTVIGYLRESDEQPTGRFGFRIEEKWNDDEGNIWYKIEAFSHTRYNHLWKISNSGNTLEFVRTRQNYPDEIDPNHSNYRIYYRQ